MPARRDQRRRRRDIERPGAVAAGPTGVDGPRWQIERRRMRPHRIDEAGHLLDRLPFSPNGDQQAGELPCCDLARHHLVHDIACLVASQRLPLEQLFDRFRQRHGRGYW